MRWETFLYPLKLLNANADYDTPGYTIECFTIRYKYNLCIFVINKSIMSLGSFSIAGLGFTKSTKTFKSEDSKGHESYTIPTAYKDAMCPEDAIFLIEQAEKTMSGVISAGKAVVDRTIILFVTASTLLTAISGYAAVEWQRTGQTTPLTLACLLSGVYLCGFLYSLFGNMRPHRYYYTGREPHVFLTDGFFVRDLPKPRIEVLRIAQLEYYQAAIAHNKQVNEKRWRLLNRHLLWVFLTPFVMYVFYFVSCIML